MKLSNLSPAFALSCLIAFGCNSGPSLSETSSNSSAKTSSTGGGSKPESTGISGNTTSTTTTSGTTTSIKGFNPNRSYQLADLQKATCTVNGHSFHLWVMDTQEKQMEGMMHLKNEDFKDDEGMIFVFPEESPRKFWMHNTLVDLDVTYCGKDGLINSVYTMKALDEKSDYSSKKPSQFVIELRAGTLKKLSIGEGAKWSIPNDVVAK